MGYKLHTLEEDERAHIRKQYVAFLVQTCELLSPPTALRHLMVPRARRAERKVAGTANELLDRVARHDRLHHYPSQLSGGEQQRVAMARAFITDPKILFADEPTGNLDDENANHVTDLLFGMNKEKGTTLVLV